jgi:hypothetical protein
MDSEKCLMEIWLCGYGHLKPRRLRIANISKTIA